MGQRTMRVDAQKEPNHEPPPHQTSASAANTPRSLLARLQVALNEANWPITLLVAVAMAAGWCVFFLSFSFLQVLAGIVPVTAGLFLGRRVKRHLLVHGLLLGLLGYAFGAMITFVYGTLGEAGFYPLPVAPNPETGRDEVPSAVGLVIIYASFSALTLVPFPAFGAIMAGRAEERSREQRQQVEQRGGRLDKPHTVRTLEDLRGLSLPQFGTYVSKLFEKHGFTFGDYQFLDKDKHLDLEMNYQGEPYLLRLSVADRVRPGTIESLVQDMRRRNVKGLAITSTEFTPDAQKAAKSRRNLVIIDGETLFALAEQ